MLTEIGAALSVMAQYVQQRGNAFQFCMRIPARLHGHYGQTRIRQSLNPKDAFEQCGINRVHRIMRGAGLRSQTGYGKRRFKRGGVPAVVVSNHLQRQFDVTEPNKVWVTDITYIRTYEDRLYLAVVLDLFSRQVIGWSMGARIDRQLALNALLMAVWRRQPKQTVMVHSDQGSQFSSYDWRDFLKVHNLEQSMSRRGNCHDNAVAESFFQLLKRPADSSSDLRYSR
jgi:putative transposase